jgi:hypothetical protein
MKHLKMPSTLCTVPCCHEWGGHEYPSDPIRKAKWIQAVRRLDENTMKMWTPTKSSVVCKKHFTADDNMKTTNAGMSFILANETQCHFYPVLMTEKNVCFENES